MGNSITQLLTKIFHRAVPEPEAPNRMTDEMIQEVKKNANQLKWLVHLWVSQDLNHTRFQECVDLELSRYQGLTPSFWREQPDFASEVFAERNEAIRYVMAANEAIAKLQSQGNKWDATSEAKRHYLNKYCEIRFFTE